MDVCRHIGRNRALSVLLVLALMMVGGLSCAGAPAEEAAPEEPEGTADALDTDEEAEEEGEEEPGTEEQEHHQSEGMSDVDWVADGMVTPGEYEGILDNGTYMLYWTGTDDTIRVAMQASTTGWVAVGFQPGNRMKDADIVLGMVSGGEAIVIDSYSTGDYGPHKGDAEFGGSDDLLDYGAQESDGTTVVEFERALDTGDEYDVALQNGVEIGIIWAYGSTDSEGVKHSTRGYGELVP